MNTALLCLLFTSAVAVPPMVMVPGFSNSAIEMVLDHADLPIVCKRDTAGEWVPLWPQPRNQTTVEELCWLEAFAMHYDAATQTVAPVKGITTRTVDWGGFNGMNLFPTEIVPDFLKLGWVLGENLWGAPYDWRVGPNLEPYFGRLQQLIENASKTNNDAKVVLFSPSLGPQISISFLHRMTQEWKDQYLQIFIAESPVWSGTLTAIEAFMVGFGGGGFSSLSKELMQAIPTAAWMFPRAGDNATIEWTKEDPIFKTPTKSYSAFEITDAMKAAGLEKYIDMYKYMSSAKDLNELKPPGVDTYVTFGMDVNTTATINLSEELSPKMSPNVTNTNSSGDGLVPLRSSLRGTSWAAAAAAQGKKLYYQGFPHQPHAGCLYGPSEKRRYANDSCWEEVAALIINGTVPPQAKDLAALSPPALSAQIDEWMSQ